MFGVNCLFSCSCKYFSWKLIIPKQNNLDTSVLCSGNFPGKWIFTLLSVFWDIHPKKKSWNFWCSFQNYSRTKNPWRFWACSGKFASDICLLEMIPKTKRDTFFSLAVARWSGGGVDWFVGSKLMKATVRFGFWVRTARAVRFARFGFDCRFGSHGSIFSPCESCEPEFVKLVLTPVWILISFSYVLHFLQRLYFSRRSICCKFHRKLT